jgi:hypothetical protein
MGQRSTRADQAARAVDKAERAINTVVNKARTLEAGIKRDPIKTLGLRYLPGEGLQGNPVHIESGGIKLSSAGLPPSEARPVQFSPPRAQIGTAYVEPLDLIPMPGFTLVALRIGHDDAANRPRIGLLNRKDPAESAIFLLDEDNSQYYYPVSTDLGGEILPNYPKVGIVAFEPFRLPTDRVSIHIRELQLTAGRGERLTAAFTALGNTDHELDLASRIEAVIALPSLAEEVEKRIRAQLEPQLAAVRTQASPGCMFILGVAAVAGAAAIRALGLIA